MGIHLKEGESLSAVLGGAAATANPSVNIEWQNGAVRQTSWVTLSGASVVTLLLATDAAGIALVGLSVCNTDTAAITLTLCHVINSVSYTLRQVTLQVGDTLLSDGSVSDSSGKLKQSSVSTSVEPFVISPYAWRETAAINTPLPTSATSTILGLINGTNGTNFPTIQSSNSAAATTTATATVVVPLPANYVPGSAVTIRVHGGMLTTVAGTSATVGLNVYSNTGNNLGSADLNTTSAQSINSLTFADKDFVITPTGLVAGQLLNIKLSVAIVDSATATAVIGAVGSVQILAPINS